MQEAKAQEKCTPACMGPCSQRACREVIPSLGARAAQQQPCTRHTPTVERPPAENHPRFEYKCSPATAARPGAVQSPRQEKTPLCK